VFASPSSDGLSYNNWRARIWLPAAKAAGFEGLTFHDLKHTAGTELVRAGVDVKTAQVRLGHASPVTTFKIYAQATGDADQDAAERVGESLVKREFCQARVFKREFLSSDGRAMDRRDGLGREGR
jgi:integrase